MSRKLFVGNLPFSTGENELQDLFGQAGAIESVRVMRDNATGRARGFAFVEMQTEEDAQAAIQKFNGADMGGRALVVNEARPKPEFGGGSGGGRDRGDRGGRGGGGGGHRRSEPRW
jgi:RNA recognition motif-containing protein